MALTVNEAILDRAIKHGIFLERYKGQVARDIIAYMNDSMFPALQEQILRRLSTFTARGFDPGPGATNRLQLMQYAVNDIVRGGMQTAKGLVVDDLVKMAKVEGQFSTQLFDSLTPLQVQWSLPSAGLLRQVVTQRPFGGALLKDWFQKMALDTRNNVMRTVRYGIASGQTTDEIVRELLGTRAAGYKDGILDATRRSANALVRTAASSVATQAREEVFKENEDILDGEMWVATLDDRTCVECGALDGVKFEIDDGERPPIHPNCRCTMVPVVKSWKQLGIDLEEAPPGTRSSMDGEVPSTVNFEDWLNGQDEATQAEVLGATRADLFRSGDLTIKDFVDTDTGKLMTLDQLKAAEPDVFSQGKSVLEDIPPSKWSEDELRKQVVDYQNEVVSGFGGFGKVMGIVDELPSGGLYFLDPVSSSFRAQVEAAYQAVPLNITKMIQGEGYRVLAMNSTTLATNDVFKGLGADIIGVHSPREQVIAIAEYNGLGYRNNAPYNTVMHEVGHFVDGHTMVDNGVFVHLSSSQDFMAGAMQDLADTTIRPEGPMGNHALDYFTAPLLRTDELKSGKELWSELFANWMGGHDDISDDLLANYPEAWKAFKAQMSFYKIANQMAPGTYGI
jgi:SPP1 gp7 family putative phage head morphogenesis protein